MGSTVVPVDLVYLSRDGVRIYWVSEWYPLQTKGENLE